MAIQALAKDNVVFICKISGIYRNILTRAGN